MKKFTRGVLWPALAAGLVLGLPGCNNDEAAPTPVPTPTPSVAPVRGVLAQFSFDQFYSGVYVAIPLPLSQGGILDVTLDWTFQDTWMYVYIARGTCDYDQLSTKTCPYIVTSETQTPKPRFVATQPIAPGTYSLILYNVEKDRKQQIGSDNIEAVSCQIGLTVGVPGTPTSQAPTTINVKPVIIRR